MSIRDLAAQAAETASNEAAALRAAKLAEYQLDSIMAARRWFIATLCVNPDEIHCDETHPHPHKLARVRCEDLWFKWSDDWSEFRSYGTRDKPAAPGAV